MFLMNALVRNMPHDFVQSNKNRKIINGDFFIKFSIARHSWNCKDLRTTWLENHIAGMESTWRWPYLENGRYQKRNIRKLHPRPKWPALNILLIHLHAIQHATWIHTSSVTYRIGNRKAKIIHDSKLYSLEDFSALFLEMAKMGTDTTNNFVAKCTFLETCTNLTFNNVSHFNERLRSYLCYGTQRVLLWQNCELSRVRTLMSFRMARIHPANFLPTLQS